MGDEWVGINVVGDTGLGGCYFVVVAPVTLKPRLYVSIASQVDVHS